MKARILLSIFLFFSLAVSLKAQQGGYALQFDGTDDYVNCGNSSSFYMNGGSAITIEAWINTKNINQTWQAIAGKQIPYNGVYSIIIEGNSKKVAFYLNLGGTWLSRVNSITELEQDKWYHVAATYDGSTAKMYINGKLDNSAACSGTISDDQSVSFYIGKNNSVCFNGNLDEIRVWNVARTEAEIKTNMYKEIGTHTNLKAYYKMSDGTGSSLTDNSGNSNTGTLTSGPVWKASGCFAGSRQALDFDGTNDYVNLPSSFSNAFDGLQHFSFCGWVYHTTLNTNLWGTYFTRYNSSDWNRVTFHSLPSGVTYGYDDIMISIDNETYGHAYTTSNVLEINKWIHLAVVYDGTQATNAGKIKVFVNGCPEVLDFDGTTFPASFGSVDQYQYLGRYHNPDYFKGGKFDEFSFWNVSLTESQIRELMFKSLAGNENGLFAYYRFDQYNQTGGATLYDMTANGHNGTLTNMDPATDWVSSTAFNTWLGGESNGWATAGNWSNGVPSSAQSDGIYNWSAALPNVTTYLPVLPATIVVNNLLIPAGVSASENVNLTATGSAFQGSNLTLSSSALNTAKNLVIGSGKTLTIPASCQLTVSSLLTNSAGNSGLVIESGGSLIHNSNSVAATVKREITGSSTLTDNKYHFVGIPTQYAEPTSNLFLGSYLYNLDPTQQINPPANPAYGNWVALGTSTTTPLSLNQGYMVYYPGASKTYTFEGNLNNGTYNYALTGHAGTGVYTFNLIPNPYPSAVVWNTAGTGWTESAGVGGTCYVWNAESGNYANIASAVNAYIPAGQALMVLVTNEALPTLSVNNNARAHSTQAFYKSVSNSENQLVVKANSNNYADETVVKFTPEATENFDLQTDGMKLFGLDKAPQVYTLSGDTKLSINNMPMFEDQKTVPMNFETQFTGQVSFTISGIESFDPSLNICLKDELTSQTINLRNQQVYTFSHNPENAADRFKLVFGGAYGIGEGEGLSGNIRVAGNTIYINAPNLAGETAIVEVFNAAGQVVFSKEVILSDLTSVATSLSGFAVIRVTTSEGVMVKKGIFR